jgi:predicted membrane protein
VLIIASLVQVALHLIRLNPIKAFYRSAMINGVAAVCR